MSDGRKKEWDRTTNSRRNEKHARVTFNMKKELDRETYEKYLQIKAEYKASDSQTIKNLILEKYNS